MASSAFREADLGGAESGQAEEGRKGSPDGGRGELEARGEATLRGAEGPEVPPRVVLALRVANVVAFASVCVVNGLGASGVIAGRSQGDVSDANPTPITPSGYAFSIWGLIYFFQAALWLVYSFLPRVNRGLVFGAIGPWNVVLCALNCAWIFTFSYELLWLSSAVIWLILLTLLTIYARIHALAGPRTWMEYLFVYVPWALYTSWVLGASLIAIFIPLGKRPEDAVYGGLAALAFAAFANIAVLAWTRDVVFAAVNVWTLVAIAAAQAGLPLIQGASWALAGTVGACAMAVWALNLLELSGIGIGIGIGQHWCRRPRGSSAASTSEPMLAASAATSI